MDLVKQARERQALTRADRSYAHRASTGDPLRDAKALLTQTRERIVLRTHARERFLQAWGEEEVRELELRRRAGLKEW